MNPNMLMRIAALACVVVAVSAQTPTRVTREQVEKWMTEISNWGRWGKDDQRGTLNLITPEKRRQAVRLVRDGISVSLAHTLDKEKFPDNRRPIGQQMTLDAGGPPLDLTTIWYHWSTYTPIGAPSDFLIRGKLFNRLVTTAKLIEFGLAIHTPHYS